MAIYGIGANYDNVDVSQEFINGEIACIGWDISEAPELYQIFRNVKNGDVIYIKSFSPSNGLYIKAVGIVTNNEIKKETQGLGVSVKWIWDGYYHYGKVHDKYNVRSITIYEEYNKDIQDLILDLIFSKIAK